MSPRASSEALAAARVALDCCSHAGERYIFEMAALLEGLKTVVRVQVENDAEYAALGQFAHLHGLAIAHSPTRMKVAWKNSLGDTFLTSVPWDDPDGTSYAAYLAYRRDDAEEAAQVESQGTAEQIGHLLGCPKCCCTAYERLENQEFWVQVLSEHSADACYPPWANRYAYLLYGASLFPDYFPCSLGCADTHVLAMRMYGAALKTDLQPLAEKYLALMQRPVVLGSGFMLGVVPQLPGAPTSGQTLALHEWIEHSGSQALPPERDIHSAVTAREDSLKLLDGSAARIIYFDK